MPEISDRERDVQSWIQCPECDSDDARMLHWYGDNEITFACPDCENVYFGAEGMTEASIDYIYGDEGVF